MRAASGFDKRADDMTEKAFVVDADGGTIFASFYQKEECASCASGSSCRKNSCFEVSNPKNFSVKKGDEILVCASKTAQALQGIVSLLLPVIFAVIGYVAVPFAAQKFGRTISADERAVAVLLFLFLSSAAVFVFTRKFPVPGKAEILEVL